MEESRLLKMADLGVVMTEEQLGQTPGLEEVRADATAYDLAMDARHVPHRSLRLDAIWDVIEEEKGGGIQSQLAGYLPGSLDEQICLRDSDGWPLVIAARRFVCDVVNGAVPLRGNSISNGCYWINVESGISYLVLRTQGEVLILDGAGFWCGVYDELEAQCDGGAVTIEVPSTGIRYSGNMSDVSSSAYDPLFVYTEEQAYVVTDEDAAIADFSELGWDAFCRGDNP